MLCKSCISVGILIKLADVLGCHIMSQAACVSICMLADSCLLSTLEPIEEN